MAGRAGGARKATGWAISLGLHLLVGMILLTPATRIVAPPTIELRLTPPNLYSRAQPPRTAEVAPAVEAPPAGVAAPSSVQPAPQPASPVPIPRLSPWLPCYWLHRRPPTASCGPSGAAGALPGRRRRCEQCRPGRWSRSAPRSAAGCARSSRSSRTLREDLRIPLEQPKVWRRALTAAWPALFAAGAGGPAVRASGAGGPAGEGGRAGGDATDGEGATDGAAGIGTGEAGCGAGCTEDGAATPRAAPGRPARRLRRPRRLRPRIEVWRGQSQLDRRRSHDPCGGGEQDHAHEQQMQTKRDRPAGRLPSSACATRHPLLLVPRSGLPR